MPDARLLLLAAAVALASACGGKAARTAARGGGSQAEPDIRGDGFVAAPQLGAVRFEFDRHHLGAESRELLKRNAAAIKKNPGWEVLVEGHCDERGTTEYNLALGQLRAKAVRDYYLMLGVPGDRIGTISYGEERPACEDASKECWSRSRRAEHKIRGEASVAKDGSSR